MDFAHAGAGWCGGDTAYPANGSKPSGDHALTTFDDDEYVFEGLRAGAVGYLLKDVSSTKLVEAIRSAARGERFAAVGRSQSSG